MVKNLKQILIDKSFYSKKLIDEEIFKDDSMEDLVQHALPLLKKLAKTMEEYSSSIILRSLEKQIFKIYGCQDLIEIIGHGKLDLGIIWDFDQEEFLSDDIKYLSETIYNSKGEILGFVDLFYTGNILPTAKSLLQLTAEAIHNSMQLNRQKDLTVLNEMIIDALHESIVIVNKHGIIVGVNKAAEEEYGYSREELIGKGDLEVFHGGIKFHHDGRYTCKLIETAETGIKFKDVEVDKSTPERELVMLVDTHSFNDENGNLIGAMVVSRDITERKKMERELAEANLQLQNMVITDGLTKLFTHQYFQDCLVDKVNKAKETGTTLSVIMLDIDDFKNYNDTLGHPAGDKLLKEFSDILRDKVRLSDIIARYGGEEFAIILPNTSASRAVEIAERIRVSVEEYPFEGKSIQPLGKVTASLGVACFPLHTKDANELVKIADDALYQAKRSEKNKVILYR